MYQKCITIVNVQCRFAPILYPAAFLSALRSEMEMGTETIVLSSTFSRGIGPREKVLDLLLNVRLETGFFYYLYNILVFELRFVIPQLALF